MGEPLLSIIIVSYENSSLVLRRALQSVLEQSYKNYEIILVDANESGNAYSLGLREDMEHYPDIPVISCPSRKGEFAAAKNQGAAQANGTYLAFLMARDAWNQECAASQIEVLEENPDVALVFCQSWRQEEDALSTQYRHAPELPVSAAQNGAVQSPIHSVSQVMFRRSAFEDMLGFDTHIHRQDDYDMWIRLSEKNRLAAIDQNLVCSYVEKRLLKKTHKLIDVVGYLQLYSKHRDMYRKNPEARYELYQKIAACYKDEGYYFTWFKYAVKIRGLEMRLGKKKQKDKIQVSEAAPAYNYNVVSSQDKEYIAVVKRVSSPDGTVSSPESGAQFQIFRKDAGSFDAAMANERDMLVCDSDGFAKTKGLSQGVYIVRQVEGQEGAERAADIEVELGRTGRTHTLSVNSELESFYVKVFRLDAETGKVIPAAGGAYRLTDSAGRAVVMSVTYPEPMQLETFATGSNGYFVTPSRLAGGTYSLTEELSLCGYVKSGQSQSFKVSRDSVSKENGIPVVTVMSECIPQKVRIHLHKNGPVVQKVQTAENTLRSVGGFPAGGSMIYTPYFEEANAEGAVYEIIADEDIITADGTTRLAKDETAAVVITNENGDAVTTGLYPGKYRIYEKKAANGLLRNTEIQDMELVYDENGTAYIDVSTEFGGARQKVSIHLEKSLGEDQIFGIGTHGEIKDFVFGLFAAEDIRMSDGTVIPRDGMIATACCEEDGKACFTADIPYGNYYVKEILTNSHYRCSDTRYPILFAYQDQDEEEVQLYVNDGNPIPSEMIRGSIHGLQTDQHKRPLALAEIGLFVMETEEYTKENAVLVAITDWNGMFTFKDIPCGDYVVRELKAPGGYIMNEGLYYLSLTFDNQRIDLKLINHKTDK